MTLEDHIARVIRRVRAFLAADEPGHFLINAHVPAPGPAVPPLYEFDLPGQLHDWLDHKLAAARPGHAIKQGIDDDAIPAAMPHFGIAEHSAWLGMDVQYQHNTCLPVPLIREPADLDRIMLSEENLWFRIMRDSYDYLRSKKDGTFVLAVRGTMAPMDVANAVRGDELFVDVLAEPEFTHRLMSFLTKAIDWYYRHLRSWADEFEGGHVFSFGGTWFGPDFIGHMSNDAAMLCGPDVYEQFGFPYERELIGRYGGCLYHVHNQLMHYVPRLAQLPKLSVLEVAPDPKTLPLLEDLPRIFAATGEVALMLHGSSDQVRAHIDELAQRNVFLDVHCRDRADAADLVAFVRDRSKPLG